MIYVKHDFYSNLIGSSKSGDTSATKDILLNEVSDLVSTKPKDVIELLNKVEISTKENATKGDLIAAVVENISENKKLLKGISYLIAEKNGLLKVEDNSGVDGNKKDLTQVVDRIASEIKPVAEKLITDKDKKEALETLKSTVKAKTGEEVKTSKEGEKSNTGLYIGIAIVAVLAGVGIYYYMKHKKSNNIAIENGNPIN
jgi:Fe2+ transport system protein B